MSKFKILYAEDDATLAFLTTDNLEQNNYEVFHFADGKTCLENYKKDKFDICVFDIMMPKIDGFELVNEIRKIDSQIPIIFLSAKTLKDDRIKGLRLGADDYLIKPFSIEELILKIEIFLKRTHKQEKTEKRIHAVGSFEFHPKDFNLKSENETINLTQRESELLEYFLENKNIVLKREQILKQLWGDDDYFMGRSLDVFISRLRKILYNQPNISIENLHGIGFKFSIIN